MLVAALLLLVGTLVMGCADRQRVEHDWSTPSPEERFPDLPATTTTERSWSIIRHEHPEPTTTTVPVPTTRAPIFRTPDDEIDPVDPPYIVSGVGQCFGDMRWAAQPPDNLCPMLHLDGRYRPESDMEGICAIAPWREPEDAKSQDYCWVSNYDDPILDTADCPGPQFLSVNAEGPWTIRFVPQP